MSVEVRIPTVLRKHTDGQKLLQGSGASIREVLTDLGSRHPGLAEAIVTADGTLAPFVNMYLNDEDVRYLEQLDSKVAEGDVISILPAVAGG